MALRVWHVFSVWIELFFCKKIYHHKYFLTNYSTIRLYVFVTALIINRVLLLRTYNRTNWLRIVYLFDEISGVIYYGFRFGKFESRVPPVRAGRSNSVRAAQTKMIIIIFNSKATVKYCIRQAIQCVTPIYIKNQRTWSILCVPKCLGFIYIFFLAVYHPFFDITLRNRRLTCGIKWNTI